MINDTDAIDALLLAATQARLAAGTLAWSDINPGAPGLTLPQRRALAVAKRAAYTAQAQTAQAQTAQAQTAQAQTA